MTGLGPRSSALEKLAGTRSEPLDLLVIGGGITGAGVALDAVSRGMTVGLVERWDFAAGTSSRSSKLVHGGLRYLEHGDFGLVREASTERDLLGRLAPHLVEPIPFVIPIHSRRRRAVFGVGLWTYDVLAGFKNPALHRHLDRQETERLVPALPKGQVRGGYIYYDSKTDDARLVMEVLVQAVRRGAVVANHAAVRHLSSGSQLRTAVVEDTVTAQIFEVQARHIVVAAGVWSDHVQALVDPAGPERLSPSKGAHIVLARHALPVGDVACVIPDPDGRRMLFVIPWRDAVLVGTTDTTYVGDLDQPVVDESDRRYCLNAVNSAFGVDVGVDDIVGAYAGLRPLVAGKAGQTADLSRRHTVFEMAPGIIGITGGKLTTYRRMAADAVDRVASALGVGGRSRTRWIRLGCSDVETLTRAVVLRSDRLGIDGPSAENLVRLYGDRALQVLDIVADEGLAEPLTPGRPSLAAEAAYCARAEMAVHVNDLLARRTRLAVTDDAAGIGRGSLAAEVMAAQLGWSMAERRRQIDAHRAIVEHERDLALPPASGALMSPAERAETG